MAISRVDFFGRTLVDLTADTVAAPYLLGGVTAHDSAGEAVTGTLGSPLTFSPGSTLSVRAVLTDGDGVPYEMADGETLRLHMWWGADTIDAESATAALSVAVPEDAPPKLWHWTLELARASGARILAALGDAECAGGGDAGWQVPGTVDARRAVTVADSVKLANAFAVEVRDAALGAYSFHGCTLVALKAPTVTAADGDDCFYKCALLRSVELPACTTVGSATFNVCTALESVELPACTTLGGSAFFACTALQSVELPACTTVGSAAFNSCSGLRKVELPAATSIAQQAFYRCFSLTVLLLPGEQMAALTGSNALADTAVWRDGVGAVYVNDELVGAYKAATNWAVYASVIRPISEWDGTVPDAPGYYRERTAALPAMSE